MTKMAKWKRIIEEYAGHLLFPAYSFLFIFTTVNREFVLFGLDLRYPILVIGVILVLLSFFIGKNKKNKIKEKDSVFLFMILLFAWCLISNISWLWNGIELRQDQWIAQNILLINNALAVVVYYRFKDYNTREQIYSYMIFSCMVLVLSIALMGMGFKLSDISGSAGIKGMVQSSSTVAQKNFFGGDFRIAGYAEDANYASILLTLGIVAVLQFKKLKTIFKVLLSVILLVALGFASSKTILASIIIGVAYVLVRSFIKDISFKRLIDVALIVAAVLLCEVLPKMHIMSSMQTMSDRYVLWDVAEDTFKKSPVIGNGIGSVRSAINMRYRGWFVQPHSSYWQLLSETGIIGLIIYVILLAKSLGSKNASKLDIFAISMIIIFGVTFEVMQLQFFVFVLYIMIQKPRKEIDPEEQLKNKKALFIVNSLGNGGAERVTINMANALVKKGYGVDFLLIKPIEKNCYELDSSFNIVSLNIASKNKLIKVIKTIAGVKKINEFIRNNAENYVLITSHLPMSNILTRFSCASKAAIYVFHTKIKSTTVVNDGLYKIALKCFFRKRKVVTVSEGVRDEAINQYHMNQKFIKTIYNPLNLKEINERSTEKVNISEPYILCAGRFNDAKRQDRIVDIFYRGQFYKNYVLVFCGTGENENKVKKQVDELGIKNRVMFLGWQENSYKYMKNAALLISASDYEAFPMNLVEALACGTKVVAGDCEYGPREILKGERAKYLVKKDDIDGYVDAINAALKDDKKITDGIIDQCDAEKCVESYLAFYEA